MQALATRDDPIFEVTGVPAAEILERCRQRRAVPTGGVVSNGGALADLASSPVPKPRRRAWRLSQFSQGSNLEFVQLAHLAFLNRPATSKEVAKRLRQLSSGKSRLGVIARLMLLPESCAQDLKLRGFVLKALRAYAHFSYKPSNNEPSSDRAKPVAIATTSAKDLSVAHEILSKFKAIPKIGRMQREIKQLKGEVRQLRARIGQ